MGKSSKGAKTQRNNQDNESKIDGRKRISRLRKNGFKNKLSGKGADDSKLRNAVEGDGKRIIVEMNSDGNCLFRALSDQLFYDYGHAHSEVRSDICDFLEYQKAEFSAFLVLDDEEEDPDASDFEAYVSAMRMDGEWGGNLELVVAARLYRRNITVFSANLAAFTIGHGYTDKGKSFVGPDLLLSYHDNDHYNSVRNKALIKPPPPMKTWIKPINVADENDDDEEDDNDHEPVEEAEEEISSPQSTEAVSGEAKVGHAIPNKAVKKNAQCPCGSGRRYKKCCLAKEKHAERLRRLKGSDTPESSDSDDLEMDGNFRILKI